MKKNIALFGLLLASFCAAKPATQAPAKVPFTFQINGQTMPAGTYSIHQLPTESTAILTHLESGRSIRIFRTGTYAPFQTARLVFRQERGTYQLTRVF